MKLRIYISFGIVLFLLFAGILGFKISGSGEETKEAYTSNNLIRLHVVANSNSPEDQELKLDVRDAILAATGELFNGAVNTGEARDMVLENMDYITQVALEEVKRKGGDYEVRAEYGRFPFPEKTYGNLTLPEGNYNALKVVIGEGEGANWWCVLFPPLCFSEEVGGVEILPEGDEPVSGGKLIFKIQDDLTVEEESFNKGTGEKGIEFRFKSRSSRRFLELLATPLSYLYSLFTSQ